jgi:diguanylate cyclase (GGDEF)-like protein
VSQLKPQTDLRMPRLIGGANPIATRQGLDLSALMASAGEVAFAWDYERDTITWDQTAAEVLGVGQIGDLLTGSAFQLRIAADFLEPRRLSFQAASGASRSIAYCVAYRFHPAGRTYADTVYLEEQGCWWAGIDGQPIRAHGVMRVVTHRYQAEEMLRFRGQHDALTGQLIRPALIEALGSAMARAEVSLKPCAFLVASVNGLDVVNSTFGFDTGDEMLAKVAQLIKRQLRHGDHLGRLASNKFGIVLNDCGPGIMRVVADRLMAAVRMTSISTTTVTLAASVSIGGVGLADVSAGPEQALGFGLQALDRARRRRLDSFVAYEAGSEEASLKQRNTALANALMQALDEDRMVLELQPMVCAKSGATNHYECLLRMITPEGDRVSAGEFMAIAEQIGLSRLIDLRTLGLAVGMLRQYPSLHVSLNISGLTSSDNDWLVELHRLTGGKRELTSRLTIEITETAALHDLDQTMVFVDTIKDLGCKAAIDDFGVGYTNFRNLKLLNADVVKIDGAFVRNVCNDKGDQVFIRSMVELAAAFGMKTVAEWVGDAATAAYLKDAGIDYLQGYFFSPPAPPEVFLGKIG